MQTINAKSMPAYHDEQSCQGPNGKPLVCWIKISEDDILKYFSYFSQKTGFGLSCKLSAEIFTQQAKH